MNRDEGKALLISVVLLAMLFSPMIISPFIKPIAVIDNLDDNNNSPDVTKALSSVTATALYNVSAYSLAYGSNTTIVFGGAMNVSDNTNASFVEEGYTVVSSTLLGDAYTDDATLWDEQYRFKNIEVVADGATGANSIRSQFSANNGEPILAFDNGTIRAMSLDTIATDKINVSVKYSETVSIPIITYLHEITFHNSAGTYYYLILDQAITTTWTTLTGTRAQVVSVGGMLANSPINWIEFHYTTPVTNRWMYIDNLIFWAEARQHHLSLMLNVTEIAPFDSYSLNVSAASNVTSPETMSFSNGFDEAAIYDVEDTTWNNFTILLNRTKILAQTYLHFYWNSSIISDTRNSTLDIDLFQIYAWNETNARPNVDGAIVNNLDDTNRMYAGYRQYQFELNVSDADGFTDIDYARIGLETEDGEYLFKAGFQEDSVTFVEETNPNNITLSSSSTNTSSGTAIYIIFYITIETSVPAISGLLISCYVNDTAGLEDHPDYALDYETENVIDVSSTDITPDEGPAGGYTTITGYLTYFNSSDLIPAATYYDVWIVSQNSTIIVEVDGWSTTDGYFTVNVLTMSALGTEAFQIEPVAEGGTGGEDTCLCHDNQYVYFTAMPGGSDGDDGGEDVWWLLDWEDDWFIIIIILIIMIMIMTGCCGMGGCGGCGGEGEDGFGCRVRRPRTPKIPLSRKRRSQTSQQYNRGRVILGGFRLRKPFTLVRKGMSGGTGLAKAIKAMFKGLKFKR